MRVVPIKTDDEAADAGISPLAEVRQHMIEARNGALDALGDPQAAHAAVFFSHVVWWLSAALEGRDGPEALRR